MTELGELRRRIIARECPVLMEAADVAIALDITEWAVRDRFDNMVMAGDRFLYRAAEVRAILIANRPAPAPAYSTQECLSCGEPVPLGSRRFCSTRCSRMTPSGRARLRAARALEKVAEMAVISDPPFCGNEQVGVTNRNPASEAILPSGVPENTVLVEALDAQF